MDSHLLKLLWISFTLISFLQSGLCATGVDDYINDDYDEDREDEYTGPPPVLTSTSLHLTVKEGQTVYLPCNSDNGDSFAKVWYHNADILFADQIAVKIRQNIRNLQNHTLAIKDIGIADSGGYRCRIESTPAIELNHTIQVVRPATIRIRIPDVPKGERGLKKVRKGEPFTLACEPDGHPPPEVTWSRGNNKHFFDNKLTKTGNSITFNEATREHSGMYECFVSNGYGNDSALIDVKVLYKPEIELAEDTVMTSVGFEPEIMCKVHAEPKARVTWYRSGKPLKTSERLTMTTSGNVHSLQIKGVHTMDFGSYTCHAENEFGTTRQTIILSGVPKTPAVRLVTHGGHSELEWTVESYSTVKEFQIRYNKENDTNEENTITIVNTSGAEGNIYQGSTKLADLALPDGELFIHVRASNSHGWSPLGTIRIKPGDTNSAVLSRPFLVNLIAPFLLYRMCL